MVHPDDEGFTYASDADWDREGARERGRDNLDHAWILTDRDCWYANPFYQGPAVRHPEDDSDCYEDEYPADYVAPPETAVADPW